MKNLGIILGVGAILYLKSKAVKVNVLSEDPEEEDGGIADPEGRQITSEDVMSGELPVERGLYIGSAQISNLNIVCDGFAQFYPWMINYLKDKDNMLATTSEASIKEAIGLVEDLKGCVDLMCSFASRLSHNKELSETLISQLNESATCMYSLQANLTDDYMDSLVYPPENIPNFFGN